MSNKIHIMKFSSFLLVIFLFFFAAGFSQITFEPGYFIDNDNVTVQCLIRDRDWNNNPTKFEYKRSESEPGLEKSVDEAKEFCINNISKYVRADVNIDRSSTKANYLTHSKYPDFKNERMFLKVLVDGSETLYKYSESGLEKFFFKNNKGEIEQLVYKKYLRDATSVAENNQFRNQIWNEAKCENASVKSMDDILYTENSLVAYFKSVNNCASDGSTPVFESKRKTGAFNIKGLIGYSTYEFELEKYSAVKDGQFHFGFEAEYILPTNKNKWGIFIAPTYNKLDINDRIVRQNGTSRVFVLNYTYLELSFGVRHYFFLNENSKLYLSGVMMTDIEMDSEVLNPNLTISDFIYNFGVGLGFNYKKASLEVRYNRAHSIIMEEIHNDLKSMSFSVRYIIFGKNKNQ